MHLRRRNDVTLRLCPLTQNGPAAFPAPAQVGHRAPFASFPHPAYKSVVVLSLQQSASAGTIPQKPTSHIAGALARWR